MDWNLVKRLGVYVAVFCIVTSPLLVLAQGGLVPCSGTGAGESGECSFTDLVIMVNKIIDFLIKDIALPISALLFAWAGFLYLTAAGDGGKVKKAHGIFMNVFVGLILTLAAWLIINLITTLLAEKGINQLLGNP